MRRNSECTNMADASTEAKNPSAADTKRRVTGFAWWLGAACCILSAIGYTAADGFVRDLIERVDSYRILLFKETLSGVIIGSFAIPLLIHNRRRIRAAAAQRALTPSGIAPAGPQPWPLGRMIAWTLFGAFICQVPGNFSQLWALRQVGIAVTGPVSLGTTILFAALLGHFLLRERITLPILTGVTVLILSIVLLGISGTSGAPTDAAGTVRAWIPGIAVATLCGFSCASLSAIVRHVGNSGAPVWLPAFIVPMFGFVATMPMVLAEYGFSAAIFDISRDDIVLIVAAAICNVVAFIAICLGIQLTSVVFGNVSGTIRMALVAVLGVFLFHEPGSILLTAGVLCACAGTVMVALSPPRRDITSPSEHSISPGGTLP